MPGQVFVHPASRHAESAPAVCKPYRQTPLSWSSACVQHEEHTELARSGLAVTDGARPACARAALAGHERVPGVAPAHTVAAATRASQRGLPGGKPGRRRCQAGADRAQARGACHRRGVRRQVQCALRRRPGARTRRGAPCARPRACAQAAPQLPGFTRRPASLACASATGVLTRRAAPAQDYAGARRAFQECVQICPSYGKAWVSWAQVCPSPCAPCADRMRLPGPHWCAAGWNTQWPMRERTASSRQWRRRCVEGRWRCSDARPPSDPVMEWRTAITRARAWQMEKRSRAAGAGDHVARCRMVLQQGLTLNPDSAPLCQARTAPATASFGVHHHAQQRVHWCHGHPSRALGQGAHSALDGAERAAAAARR